jgi:mediator of RNA polymerase II transcription subunit 17
MSGAASLSDVALRPWPAPKKDELKPADLRLQVDQLTIERGHLRNITEKSLQDDIIAGKDASSSEADEQEAKKDKKEVRSRAQTQEDIIRMQQEMCSEMEYEPWTNILQSLY